MVQFAGMRHVCTVRHRHRADAASGSTERGNKYPASEVPRCFRWNRHVHGFPHPAGPFRALCALGGLCASVFARTVFHGNRDLASYLEPASLQFESQRHLLHCFQQTRPKLRMNSVGGINDLCDDFVWLQGARRVAEIAEENKPNGGRHSTKNSEELQAMLPACTIANPLTNSPAFAAPRSFRMTKYRNHEPTLHSTTPPLHSAASQSCRIKPESG